MEKDKQYDELGNADHYSKDRINTIRILEKTFGTIATLYFCEMSALKYRLRVGKKESQNIEQELIKAAWYERAAKYYHEKLQTSNYCIGVDELEDLPGARQNLKVRLLEWEEKNK